MVQSTGFSETMMRNVELNELPLSSCNWRLNTKQHGGGSTPTQRTTYVAYNADTYRWNTTAPLQHSTPLSSPHRTTSAGTSTNSQSPMPHHHLTMTKPIVLDRRHMRLAGFVTAENAQKSSGERCAGCDKNNEYTFLENTGERNIYMASHQIHA